MKPVSLAVLVSMAVIGYAQAQAPAQSPPATPAAAAPAAAAPAAAKPAASTPAASSSSTESDRLGHECKEEVHKQCGRAHGDEMQQCIKAAMDLNKFSADCKAKLAAKAAKPSK